jgi:DNA polymerase-1
MPPSDPKFALIDGDLFIFQTACAFRSTYGFEEPTEELDLEGAIERTEKFMNDLRVLCGCTVMVWNFSCSIGDNFRRHLYEPYKSNRAGGEKPAMFEDLVDYLEEISSEELVVIHGEDLEADDLIGIQSDSPCTIVSYDKDLNQIAGEHYDWRTQTVYTVSEDEGDDYFWLQCLTGDSTDGYPGVHRVGPVTARKLLTEVYCEKDAWTVIKAAYKSRKVLVEDALVQCRLARILRPGEYADGGPILWDPRKTTRN